jgi:hypothetical protein
LRTITLLLLLLTTTSFWSQENLVLNPSFEDTASMTKGYPYRITEDWWSPNGSSADYFTPYCDDLCCGSGLVFCSNEVNSLGYQPALDGDSFIGIVIYESTDQTKEYAQGFLSTPLVEGLDYCVSVWISLADSSSLRSCDFQIAFAQENVNDGGLAGSFNFQNVIDWDISFVDTSSWTLFEGIFTAQGGEEFIYLGSNTPNSELMCVETYSNTWIWNTAYILLDNVSVKQANSCSASLSNKERHSFSISPNPTTDFLAVTNSSSDLIYWQIFDIKGIVHAQGDFYDQTQIDVSQLTVGLYVLKFDNGQVIKWIKQ